MLNGVIGNTGSQLCGEVLRDLNGESCCSAAIFQLLWTACSLGGEAPKVVVYFRIVRKRDSDFFVARNGYLCPNPIHILQRRADGLMQGIIMGSLWC
jgi:hypothetical protein